ncbi:MAG TPA: hypothetical protein PK079_12335 [Leptospiraceae bacterium]|nr:hypothetical protein [Leptospiraceae bacterium]HMW05870.1 hypothetical protein [Leptospiraceae bacterium]HMX33208.1 hypothetical protein [Leptospiraceae bacterium]HMY33656.1 hypothetical protein [Leptospiraceae bacterium]HMZ64094.1 hypothetical protein [Leptospiraceae bacterium]
MIPEEFETKSVLSDDDMQIILSAFRILEFPNYNINPRDVDYAFLYQVEKLERIFYREPIELQRRKDHLLEQCRICVSAAKRPKLFEEIIEYKKKEIKADSHFIPFKHYKEFFLNLWSDLKIFQRRLVDKPLKFINHILVFLWSLGKNLIILSLKNGWEFLYSFFTSPRFLHWVNQNWKTRLITNLFATIISFIMLFIPIYIIKLAYNNVREFWNDQLTNVENLPSEDLIGYIPKNYIIVKDKLGGEELLAIPFGTEIKYRKVNISMDEFAYYIPSIDSYIFNEELANSVPSIVASKVFTLIEEENQYIPLQNYTKKLPAKKIELFSGNFRIFDSTGKREYEGTYSINKGYISLSSQSLNGKLKYNHDGSFYFSTTVFK